jgi:hypothetical protein
VPTGRSGSPKRQESGTKDPDATERVAVVATLLPGSRDRAAEIIAKGAPYGLRLAGFRRHSVFLAEETVVFVFEVKASKDSCATLSMTRASLPRSAPGHRFFGAAPSLGCSGGNTKPELGTARQAALTVLECVEPDREGDDQSPVGVPHLRSELEHVAVAKLTENALVRPHLLLAAAEDEVEREPRQQRDTSLLAARSPPSQDQPFAPERCAVGHDRPRCRAAEPRRHREHIHARARRRARARLRETARLSSATLTRCRPRCRPRRVKKGD